MGRRLFAMFGTTALFLGFSSGAFCSVVGTWEVSGTLTVKVTIGGHSETDTIPFEDSFTFSSDGDFYSLDMEGTWVQRKRKFWVNIDTEELEYFFEDFIEELDYEAEFTVTKSVFSGNESKNGSTISGRISLAMTFYIYDEDDEDEDDEDYDLEAKGARKGKVSAVATFRGTRRSESSQGSEKKVGFQEVLYKSLFDGFAGMLGREKGIEER